MYPHRIRLRGPWEYELLSPREGGSPALPASGRMVMPTTWGSAGLSGFSGSVRLRRRFGYPGRIDPHERVWLTFAGHRGLARASLNGEVLADPLPPEGSEFEVLQRLTARNELLVEIEGDDTSGLTGEVALEVRCTAYLRRLQLSPTGQNWCLQGEVVGHCSDPLELYLVADRHTVGYLPITATEVGQPFALHFSPTGMDGRPVEMVQLELVCGAVPWYTAQTALPPFAAERGAL